MVKVSHIKNEHSRNLIFKYALGVLIAAVLVFAVALKCKNIREYVQSFSNKKYVVIKNYNNNNSDLILYNLDPINIPLGNQKNIILGITLELYKIDNIKTIEAITPKIVDSILTHVMELSPQEIENVDGFYELKEQLLYRINLITYPVTIESISFRNYEITTLLIM